MELINLKNLSLTAIAMHIWESSIIKDQVKNLFLVRQKNKDKFRQRNSELGYNLVMNPPNYSEIKKQYINFQLITSSAILNLDLIELPLELKNSCKIAVQELGDRIYKWWEYVTETLDFDFKFAEKIYRKSDGTIDEEKIFAAWENDPEFLNYKTMIGPAMHILACVNVNEDFINRNQAEMEKFLKIHMPQFELNNYNNKIYTLVAINLHLHITQQAYHIYQSIILNYIIPPYEIFSLCARCGYTKAALYFWKFIPNPSLPEITTDCLVEMHLYLKSKYQREKSIEMIIFLIYQMTAEEKSNFLQKEENVAKLFFRILPAKPNHEIISELIENYFLGLSESKQQKILSTIWDLITEYSHESTKHKKENFCSLFYKILNKLPDDLKRKIFDVSFFEVPSLKISDINILKLILSCTDPHVRFKILKAFRHGVMLLVKNKEMDKLDEFMHEILISDYEKDFFKKNLLDQFLMDAKFEIVNQLLDYFSIPPEIMPFKEGANCRSTLESFIRKWRYDKAEKFLEWKFTDEEERENYRNSLPENSFIYERTSKESDRFINEFLGNEANSKDFYNYFFGFPDEEKLIKNPELYLRFRKKLENVKEEYDDTYGEYGQTFGECNSEISLMNKFVNGKRFLKGFNDFYDESELPNLFMKWICHDKNRREAVKRKYGGDAEEEFFCKLMGFLFGQPNKPWMCVYPSFPNPVINN